MEELVYGVLKPEAVAGFQRIIGRMRDAGCDAVVLGCTEIPLIIDDTNSQLPTLDSTRLLARAALRHATTADRSEEHTSEHQSLMRISSAVFSLNKHKRELKNRMYNVRRQT